MTLYFTFFNKWRAPKVAAPYLDLIDSVETANYIPHNLLARLIQQESDFRADAHNVGSDAQGIAQIVPRWHPELLNPFEPEKAIPYAGKYLRKLYDAFGHWDLALAAYNWGRGNLKILIDMHGAESFLMLPKETQNYVKEILNDINV